MMTDFFEDLLLFDYVTDEIGFFREDESIQAALKDYDDYWIDDEEELMLEELD